MSIANRTALVLIALLAIVAGGCGGGGKAKTAKAARVIVPADVDPKSSVTADGGRITVSSPVGWRREPKSKDYVARYVPGGGRTYPSVTVLGGDPPPGFEAVDEGNHAAFVAAVAESLAGQFTGADGKSMLLRKPAAVELGPHKAVVWTAPGRAKVEGLSQPIERSCAAVVVAGRMYTVEARAPQGKLDDTGRGAGRGVAAAIAVAEAKPPETPAPATDAAPSAEPAVEPAPAPAVEPAPEPSVPAAE